MHSPIVLLALSVLLACSGAIADEAFVLRSDSTVVTSRDIDRYIIENVPSDEKRRAAVLRKPGFYKEMAETLLVVRTLANEAQTVMELDEAQTAWEAQLAYQRSLVSRYRTHYVQTLFENVDWSVAAKEEYLANPERYALPEKVSASHILINLENRSEQAALALFGSVLGELEGGADFGELAMKYSDDPSAKRNSGNLGFFARGKMTPPFENAAFALKEPGELSKPVKTQFGYHLIKLNEKISASTAPFATVEKKLIEALQTQWSDQAWQDKIIAIRSDAEIQKNEEALEGIRRRYTPVIPQP